MGLTDEPTIILSGPLSRRANLIKQLASSGYPLADGDPKHGWGMPDAEKRIDPDDGSHPFMVGVDDKTVGWITVHGENIDHVVEQAASFGYRLRAHHQGTQRTSPLLADIPIGITEDRVAELIEQALKANAMNNGGVGH